MSWFTEHLAKKSYEQRRFTEACNQAYAEYAEAFVTLNALHRQVWLQFHMRMQELRNNRPPTEYELGQLDAASQSLDSYYVLVQPAYKRGSQTLESGSE